MSQSGEGRAPEGRNEAKDVQLDEPTHLGGEEERAARDDEVRPDLDERDRRISTQRRPMGPPLRERGEREQFQRREPTEEPVDPAGPA